MPKKNQLRIIGGQWRGRKLDIADIPGLRPTGDRIRETLFNWLMPNISDSRCLDLFAGSGALGLECLSRGAQSVGFLEKNKHAARQLEQHCKSLHAHGARVLNQDALAWLNNNNYPKHSIDLAFIDPPFSENLWLSTTQALSASELLAPEALIYIESPKNKHLDIEPTWALTKDKTSGDVNYRLYRLTRL
ncbi:MAG: 16S rRNA (guanine966-N2)-methyltransferase [Cellvibrionaceae bacterium]|jgi:16S rRNA (guanine966-N2)-methyltransferase